MLLSAHNKIYWAVRWLSRRVLLSSYDCLGPRTNRALVSIFEVRSVVIVHSRSFTTRWCPRTPNTHYSCEENSVPKKLIVLWLKARSYNLLVRLTPKYPRTEHNDFWLDIAVHQACIVHQPSGVTTFQDHLNRRGLGQWYACHRIRFT
jgi:hypothetical protein